MCGCGSECSSEDAASGEDQHAGAVVEDARAPAALKGKKARASGRHQQLDLLVSPKHPHTKLKKHSQTLQRQRGT